MARVDANRTPYSSMMRGAVVEGTVMNTTRKYGNEPGVLKLKFNELRLADGATVPIDDTLISVNWQHNVALVSGTPVAVVLDNAVSYTRRSYYTHQSHYKTFYGDTSLPIGEGGNPVQYRNWWMSGTPEE